MPDEWIPVVALPNLDTRGKVECEFAAIVPPNDSRVDKLRADHPRLTTFISRFRGQFGEQVWPSLILLHANAPDSCKTAEAVTGLRDVIAMSVVPRARARRLRFGQANGLAFSTAFQLYPWMLDKQYEEMILTNSAAIGVHLLEEFHGQTFPEQSQMTVMEQDVDMPLANLLLHHWASRFTAAQVAWADKALFRSLNMANEAAGIPAPTATTFYDVGRSLAHWVSAYEIMVHPEAGISNKVKVAAELEKVQWLNSALAALNHSGPGNPPQQKQLATSLCHKIYGLRDDFLHGNDVAGPALQLNGKPMIDFAACLYRLLLTGFFDLRFHKQLPAEGDAEAIGKYTAARIRFNSHQRLYEEALLTAI
jgi:hypothetical protein